MTDPIILVADGDPKREPLLYACAKCGAVHSPKTYLAKKEVAHQAAREAAADCYSCKTHSNCQDCGKETYKGWLRCQDCSDQRKLDAATEVPDNGGPYCQFNGDSYYHDLEQAADDGLLWVSPCDATFPRIDPDNVLDGLLSDMFEDASVDDLDGVDAFYAAVKAFNDAQKTPTFFGNNKFKIKVPAQGIEASGGDGTAPSRSDESPVRKDAP